METGDFRFRNSDFGLKKLKSDYIPIKIPQSTIPNPQSNLSSTPILHRRNRSQNTEKTDFTSKDTVSRKEINH